MGMVKEIKVEFKNGQRVFWPGSLMEGEVAIHIESEVKVTGIYMTFNGQEYTKWRSSGFGNRGGGHYGRHERSETHTIFHHKVPFEKLQSNSNLAAGVAGPDGLTSLTTGVYKYPFSYRLLGNDTLPGSIENEYGHIRYWIKVVVGIPWGTDSKLIEPFLVIPIVDCNYSAFLTPVTHVTGRCLLLRMFQSVAGN